MTDEELKKIAREYAESVSYGDAEDPNIQIEYDIALPILEWLSKDYCIVPKSKLRERYKESKLHSKSESVFDIHTGIARLIMLESLFGKDMFKEDNNQ